jgi:hypothetical protein
MYLEKMKSTMAAEPKRLCMHEIDFFGPLLSFLIFSYYSSMNTCPGMTLLALGQQDSSPTVHTSPEKDSFCKPEPSPEVKNLSGFLQRDSNVTMRSAEAAIGS